MRCYDPYKLLGALPIPKSQEQDFLCVIMVADFESHRYDALMQKTRLWLMFPARLITRPILWELAKTFEIVTNIRQASVTDEIGLVSLELDGEREEIKKAIAWLEENGIKVEPVEIGTIAS